jgi:opacity protein-like surface antigen
MMSAAAAAALLAPAQAEAQTQGYVDLSVGQSSFDSLDLDTVTIGGAAVADLSGGWRAQFEADVTRMSEDDGALTLTNAAAHVYYDAGDWAVGGVLSNRDLAFASAWMLGLEGQTHLGSLVLEGEAGFGTLEAFGDELDVFNADASATWYLTDDFSIAGGVAIFDIDEFDDEFVTYGIDGEYKFQSSDFSAFAGYSQTEFDDEDIDTWRVGVRYAFGDGTLRERRRSGPRWLRGNAVFLPIV